MISGYVFIHKKQSGFKQIQVFLTFRIQSIKDGAHLMKLVSNRELNLENVIMKITKMI